MKHGPWSIEEKDGRILCRHRGRLDLLGELLPQAEVPAKDGQFDLGNGLTLRILERYDQECWYVANEIYDTLEAAVNAYQAAGYRVPTPALAQSPGEH